MLGVIQRVSEAEIRVGGERISRIGGGVLLLVVSQFTLLVDTRKGRRPSFSDAAKPEQAEPLYRSLIDAIRSLGVPVQEGRFRAMMEVKLVNSGPVTVIVNSKEKKWN